MRISSASILIAGYYDKKEQIIDRFANVYSTFSQRKDAIAMLVNRTIEGADFILLLDRIRHKVETKRILIVVWIC